MSRWIRAIKSISKLTFFGSHSHAADEECHSQLASPLSDPWRSFYGTLMEFVVAEKCCLEKHEIH